MKNRLRAGSAADKILSIVISSGEIKKHKIRDFIPDMSKNGYYKAYNSLLEKGYIQEIVQGWKGYGRPGYKGVYVSATNLGRTVYSELYGSDYVKEIAPNISGRANFDRQSKANDVNALLASCDMAYSYGEKPSLEEYLSTSCGDGYIKSSMQHGIAYSSKEVKDYLREQHISAGTNIPFDSASGSRFYDILFYKGCLFVIYNTGAKAMLWSSVTERRLKSVLCKMINESSLYENGFINRQTESGLMCIVLCTRQSGLHNLLFAKGYKAIGDEKKQAKNRKGSVTLETLTKDYGFVSIVTTGPSQKSQFMNTLNFIFPSVQSEYIDKIIALYPTLTYVHQNKAILLANGDKYTYVAMPYLDAHTLLAYRNCARSFRYCIPDGTQNIISKFVGERALGFFDADTMQEIALKSDF